MPLEWTNTGDAPVPMFGIEVAPGQTIWIANSDPQTSEITAGLLDDRGNYDASGNVWPSEGGSGTNGEILKGDLWIVSVTGTLGGKVVEVGDNVRALTDNPGQTASNWSILSTGLGFVPAAVTDSRFPTSDQKASFPATASAAAPLALLTDTRRWKGAWSSANVSYAVGDRVGYTTRTYSCILAHTSNADNDAHPGWGLPYHGSTYWQVEGAVPEDTAGLPEAAGYRYVTDDQKASIPATATALNPLVLRAGPLRPVADSVTAIQIQQADGTPFVNFDSINKALVVIGNINSVVPGGSNQFSVGQSSDYYCGFAWYKQSPAANSFASIATCSYSNPIRFDASTIILQYGSGGNVLIGTKTSSAKFYAYDNTTTAQPVLKVYQDNASNTNAVAVITGDGTGDLLQCVDGATTIFRVPDGGQASVIAALSTGGAETNANICTAVNALLTLVKNWNMMASA